MIHECDLGLGKCKLWVKDTVYCPGINEQLEQLVFKLWTVFKIFQSQMQATFKHVFGTRDPDTSWTKIVTDIFYSDGASYLLIADYTSRFPVVRKLTSMTTQHVAGQMKLVFSEYGWPETIISNNGPCYSAEAFTKLMKEYSLNHITSSPHYLQSNGLLEKYVQIVKNLFQEVQKEGTDLYKSLMIYRNTPLSSYLQSPMQILQS